MRPATYTVVLYNRNGTTERITAADARDSLRIVDSTWADAERAATLETITILRNGRAYLGCPRPE